MRCRTGIISQEPEYLSGPPHSVAVALCATPVRLTETQLQQKLLRKKKNESWAMRRFENIRGLTSPTLGVGGNLLCKIVQSGLLGVARASRVLVSASRRNNLSLGLHYRRTTNGRKVRDREDALASTRDACATQSISHSRLFSRRNPRLRKSMLRIASVLQNIPRAGVAVRRW